MANQQITELRAIDADLPDWRIPQTVFGFFDVEHLPEMSMAAADLSGIAKGVYFTLNPLASDLLARCCNRTRVTRSGEPARDVDVICRRYLLVDVDPCRISGISSSDEEKAIARNRINQVRDYLNQEGWPLPIFADSGNGFHLLYRVDLPVNDDDLLKRTLHALADRFDDDRVTIDRKVYNPSRICKLYGTMACKGDSTPERPHRRTAILEVPPAISVVAPELLAQLAPAQPGNQKVDSSRRHRREGTSTNSVLERARAYLESVPPAIAGKRGHNRTFEVACRLVIGFDLSPDDALPLLLEWNTKCEPPWSEAELLHKLHDADAKTDNRGHLVDEPVSVGAASPYLPPLDGEPFLGEVPDFIPHDTSMFRRPLSARSIRPGRGRPNKMETQVLSAVFLAAFQQKRTNPVIPDLFLRQCVFGAKWIPKKWRQRLVGIPGLGQTWELRVARRITEIQRSVTELRVHYQNVMAKLALRSGSIFLQGEKDRIASELKEAEMQHDDCCKNRNNWRKEFCRPSCPFHGQYIKHSHFHPTITLRSFGMLNEFECKRFENGEIIFDFDLRDGKGRSRMRQLMTSGDIFFDYLPVLLFGLSPRVNLSSRKVRLIRGMVRETTRKKGRRSSQWNDRREFVEHARVPASKGRALIGCPFLNKSQRYVGFNGNLKWGRGRGYAIIGQSSRGWLHRAGYSFTDDASHRELWQAVRQFLEDLRELSDPFSLTPVALCRGGGEWKSIDEMLTLLRSESGRKWLNTCRLRIYVPDNYLVVWRRWFASRLGFSYIPGGEWTIVPDDGWTDEACDNSLNSPAAVRAWLREQEMTQKDLASAIGWEPARVSHMLVGRTRWSTDFEEAVHRFASQPVK